MRRLLGILGKIAVVVVVCELASLVFASILARRVAPASTLYGARLHLLPDRCNWGEYTGLHPFLTIHYVHDPQCQQPDINQLGLVGRELPLRHDPERFTIPLPL